MKLQIIIYLPSHSESGNTSSGLPLFPTSFNVMIVVVVVVEVVVVVVVVVGFVIDGRGQLG